jgi:formate dehydrogenase maturation protein FdhE
MVSREDRRIRAKLLQNKFPESAHLLELYVQMTLLQDEIDQDSQPALQKYFHRLQALAPQIHFSWTEDFLLAEPATEEGKFFYRVLMQPAAERFRKSNDATGSTCPTCPSCGAKPVAGVLHGEGEGARRALICSMCALEWPYRRVICVNCGEEDKEKLPVYLAAQIDYVRVEACDTCHTYLKSVDLTKDGFAIPQVDEIATVALNLWADEHDYRKIETNILGM